MTVPAMTVGSVMTRCPVSVPAGASFATVAAVLSSRRIGAVPVVARDGRLVGAVSEGDLLGGRDGAGVTARELMDRQPPTVTEDVSLQAAARSLTAAGVRRLYVTAGGRLVGVVSRRDLLAIYLRDDDAIRAEVVRVLADQPPLTVEVRDGVVLLLGLVEWRSTRALLDERVSAVAGVVEVRDRLEYAFDDGARPRVVGSMR
ncbi:CBS domain-containing protein [Actinophytocola sp.]|uniref:CBS domain-containing protein n=1 Tax=Actinophytocola sp. TaxID=1872138 RepID=UPI00389B108F